MSSKTGFPASNLLKYNAEQLSDLTSGVTSGCDLVIWSIEEDQMQSSFQACVQTSGFFSLPGLDECRASSWRDFSQGHGNWGRGAVVNSLWRHLFQYGASLTHHESLPHRRWSCRYSERLQDGIHACLGWHCSRCRNWSHASNPKSLIKIYASKQHLRDPEVQLWRDPTKKHSIFWSSYMSLE